MSDNPENLRARLEMGEAAGRAYHEIRSRIMTGRLAPGAALPERELCVSVGVSRTPVREALRRLNAEGLVSLKVNRTAYVTEIDAAEIDEMFTIGALLGAYAARLAAERASEGHLAALRAVVGRLEEALAKDDTELRQAFAREGREFDLVLREATASPRLQKLIVLTLSAPVLPLLMGRLPRSFLELAVRLQRRICEAMESRDPEAAGEAMRAYSEAGREAALATFDDVKRAMS
jgi:DNA-binding GntR family transcriptional regulator